MKPRVLLADDHTLVAEALRRILEDHYECVGLAQNGRELLESARETKPDLVLLDVSMPELNGIEAARLLKKEQPDTKIIFLSMHSDPSYVTQALRSGGSGYVLKRCAASELPTAITEVLAGHTYVTPLISPDTIRDIDTPREVLTSRQREVLQLVAEGKSAKEIATTLGISVKTAEFHKAGIMQKLGVRTTAQLTKYAIEHHLTSTSIA